ncbi:MAG: FKBP-type peptidyl-prolyl cis-trans isomerase [Paludibacter sp.]|jgi:FKBP-type peptidyl-prolyl cis-trans isomerase FklB|nr:FKBP-type peptidyl-prolyl cis-trans isomerase [Paludibacter sp.]
MDKISYALGISLGANLKNNGFEALDYEKMAAGMQDVMEAKALQMTPQEAQTLINSYFQQLQEKAHAATIEQGKSFLEENAKRPGVVTTASGLQYEVMIEGKGATPAASDRVQVHYHGTLINGEVFDSSVNRGEPATFGVTQVINGWVEALQLMPVGSKWKLFIPSNLAYGAQGAGQSIGPHTTLVFEVELLAIV